MSAPSPRDTGKTGERQDEAQSPVEPVERGPAATTERILSVVLCGVTHNGRWLLIQRRKPPYEGHWGLVGGKMEVGETVAEAAVREAREETRLAVRFDRVKGVVNETLLRGSRTVAHFVLFVCRLEADGDDHAYGDEGPLRWFTPEQMRDESGTIIPTDLRMIEAMLLRRHDGLCFVEASMREHGGRYEVLRFDVQ